MGRGEGGMGWERRGGGGREWVGRGGRGWEGRGVERYLHVNIEQSQWYVLSVKTT